MKIDHNSLKVIHNQANQRFEVRVESYTAELTYKLQSDTILFTHTGVPPALEGHGIGSKLVRAGLEYAHANKLKVKTICWFVAGYIQRHPESVPE